MLLLTSSFMFPKGHHTIARSSLSVQIQRTLSSPAEHISLSRIRFVLGTLWRTAANEEAFDICYGGNTERGSRWNLVSRSREVGIMAY